VDDCKNWPQEELDGDKYIKCLQRHIADLGDRVENLEDRVESLQEQVQEEIEACESILGNIASVASCSIN
jgi:cell division septum initiation protein DivIVA